MGCLLALALYNFQRSAAVHPINLKIHMEDYGVNQAVATDAGD